MMRKPTGPEVPPVNTQNRASLLLEWTISSFDAFVDVQSYRLASAQA